MLLCSQPELCYFMLAGLCVCVECVPTNYKVFWNSLKLFKIRCHSWDEGKNLNLTTRERSAISEAWTLKSCGSDEQGSGENDMKVTLKRWNKALKLAPVSSCRDKGLKVNRRQWTLLLGVDCNITSSWNSSAHSATLRSLKPVFMNWLFFSNLHLTKKLLRWTVNY